MNTTQKRKITKEEKIICYKIDDDVDAPYIYDTLDLAMEHVRASLEGINFDWNIKIMKVEMTQEQFNNLPEL